MDFSSYLLIFTVFLLYVWFKNLILKRYRNCTNTFLMACVYTFFFPVIIVFTLFGVFLFLFVV